MQRPRKVLFFGYEETYVPQSNSVNYRIGYYQQNSIQFGQRGYRGSHAFQSPSTDKQQVICTRTNNSQMSLSNPLPNELTIIDVLLDIKAEIISTRTKLTDKLDIIIQLLYQQNKDNERRHKEVMKKLEILQRLPTKKDHQILLQDVQQLTRLIKTDQGMGPNTQSSLARITRSISFDDEKYHSTGEQKASYDQPQFNYHYEQVHLTQYQLNSFVYVFQSLREIVRQGKCQAQQILQVFGFIVWTIKTNYFDCLGLKDTCHLIGLFYQISRRQIDDPVKLANLYLNNSQTKQLSLHNFQDLYANTKRTIVDAYYKCITNKFDYHMKRLYEYIFQKKIYARQQQLLIVAFGLNFLKRQLKKCSSLTLISLVFLHVQLKKGKNFDNVTQIMIKKKLISNQQRRRLKDFSVIASEKSIW